MENNISGIGNSKYQTESTRYYTLLRDVHTKIFTFNPERIRAEKNKTRYFNGNIKGIKNLYTFISFLKQVMKGKEGIKGIDYGCGNHFFVDNMRTEFGWDVLGYDADNHAIEKAKIQYPDSAENYIYLNLLLNRIPCPDESLDFVFCNAVIQHFSTHEVCYALKDINRVLKPYGILLLIFKRNINNWNVFSVASKLKVKILDPREGMIKIEDEPMKEAIKKLTEKEKSSLNKDYLEGMRLLHFFSIDDILHYAEQYGFKPLSDIIFGNKPVEKAVFTYYSGKRIPAAAIFFEKRESI